MNTGPTVTDAAIERARRACADPNMRCARCGATARKPRQGALISAPDDWRLIHEAIGINGPEPEFPSRPDTLDYWLGPVRYWRVLCPSCLPSMSALTFAEQRYLFGWRPYGARPPAQPWGPVLPGIELPCPAWRAAKDGGFTDCVRSQGHSGRHSNGTNRSWSDEDAEATNHRQRSTKSPDPGSPGRGSKKGKSI